MVSMGVCGRSAGQTGSRLRARLWGPISAMTVPSLPALSQTASGMLFAPPQLISRAECMT